MHPAVAQLSVVMPPSPLGPVIAPPWTRIEEAMAVGLPRDYRDFIDLYGDGAINDELGVNYPAWQQDDTSTLSTLVDVAEEDNGYGVYESLEMPFPGYPAPGGLLQWGGNYNGDRLCWLTEGKDPDDWPVVVVFRHISDPSWRRFDGGMAAFLLAVVTGTFDLATTLIGDAPGEARWTLARDWIHDYGFTPSARYVHAGEMLRPGGQGLTLAGGVPVSLRYAEGLGGDQELYGRTGEVRPLIEPHDPDCPAATITLAGGGLAPGMMAYRIWAEATIDLDNAPGTLALELLRDRTPIPATTSVLDNYGQTLTIITKAEITVAAGADPAAVQLRVVSDQDTDITVWDLSLHVKGTLATDPQTCPTS
ncbi:SMI1/KNR4 family protein [Nocardia sp. NBC_00565]|uniref:SMI1/KNR4 family protein n=1 Tax=Nocardia sp. NBC_00565 TaxID=2975993 RepID=UPI002E81A5F7|nr:SMI1/KNR4 family protein [Nocardia sp. NBC_00565]WUC01382.1 SMI1/KNR4 family protein [Nocardia sp. NBC_00565]